MAYTLSFRQNKTARGSPEKRSPRTSFSSAADDDSDDNNDDVFRYKADHEQKYLIPPITTIMDQVKMDSIERKNSRGHNSVHPAQGSRWKPFRYYAATSKMQLYMLLIILAMIVALWIYTAFEFNSVQNVLMGSLGGASRFGPVFSSRSRSHATPPDPYVFEADELPSDPRFRPTISNGHIGATVYDNCIKMNALFNGKSGHSHPACIPNPFKLNWKRFSRFSTPPSSYNNITTDNSTFGAKKVLIGDKYEVLATRYQLDVRSGVFTETTNVSVLTAADQRAVITKRSFIHRSPIHNRVYVVQISYQPYQVESGNDADTVGIPKSTTTASSKQHASPLTELVLPYVSITSMISTKASGGIPTPTSPDLNIQPVQLITLDNIGQVCVMNAVTKDAEYNTSSTLNVSVVWSCAAETDASTNFASEGVFRLRAGQETTLLASISVEQNDAVQHYISAWQQRSTLLAQHQQAWGAIWSAGRIEVDPSQSLNLSQAVAAAQYYLWTDIRLLESDVAESGRTSVLDNVPYMGLPPGGLAKGAYLDNYQGHVFWDMDTWMFPGILWTQPLLARQLIRARAFQLDSAKENARQQGDQGARFPWESARTGLEVSPWNISGIYEIHVSCDISMALKTYLETTGDIDAIARYRFGEMAFSIAEYYLGRSVLDANGTRHIYSVCPPDEYHAPVNDSVYTNYCAAQALLLPQYLCTLTTRGAQGRTVRAAPDYCTNNAQMLKQFVDAAHALVILLTEYNGVLYHPEFAGFEPGKEQDLAAPVDQKTAGKTKLVKQADVILMQYPLMANESTEIQRNDLGIYEKVTDFDGPAMTWGSFAINLLELGQTTAADTNFIKQYVNIVPGFGMWSESPKGAGAVNFLTGMGGFLQSIVNGYFGLRIDVAKYAQYDTDLDTFNCFRIQPRALPGNIPYTIVGLNFQNATFNVEITDAYYAYMTLDAVPRNVKLVNICDKLMANTCKLVEPGKEVIVSCGLEKFVCLTFA